MQPSLRPFTDNDYAALCAFRCAAEPDYPVTVEELKYHDAHRDPKCLEGRWLCEKKGDVVASAGYSQSPWAYHPKKFWLSITVHPERRRQGIGGHAYDHLLAALEEFEPLSVSCPVKGDREEAIRFLQKRGFQEVMRDWESRLDVTAFDPAPFAGAQERVRNQGIEIRTLRELEADPDHDRKIYELEQALNEDVPSVDPVTAISYEQFLAWMNSPNLLPDGYFVAVHGDRYIGISHLWNRQGSDDLETGLTGVLREYRRRGIALALKLCAIEYARAHGRRVIRTENNTGNRGMLAINERLGFVKQPPWLFMRKVLREEE
jgi:GNAT superfamily N-acetyltransferase